MKNIKFAIEYLKNNSHKMIENGNNYATQSVNLAIEALEKQIPKKPIVTSKGEEKYSGCPVCNKFVFDDYCQCCGQAIDWE